MLREGLTTESFHLGAFDSGELIKGIKHIEKEFTFCHLGQAPGSGLGGAG